MQSGGESAVAGVGGGVVEEIAVVEGERMCLVTSAWCAEKGRERVGVRVK